MVHASISEMTTFRRELADEIPLLARHGFDSIALWRTKLSDIGVVAAVELLGQTGLGVSSLQWVGGFTGSDGRSFSESGDDALEAVVDAAALGAEVVVVRSGGRGGHTRRHALRLLAEAFDVLAPESLTRGVTLALEPMHPAVSTGGGFLASPAEALAWVRCYDHPAVRLSLDLWQFGYDRGLFALLGDLVPLTAHVQVADGRGAPALDAERLPPGQGTHPLAELVSALLESGYGGPIEFSPVGDAVEALGYDQVLEQARIAASAWEGLARIPA